jgi:OmpA-OmpF porin, OOP family
MAAIRQRGRRCDRRGYDRVSEHRRVDPFLIAAAFLAAALAAIAPARAQDTGAYLGAGLGVAKFTKWCDTGDSSVQLASCDDSTLAWKGLAGYRFNPYVGAEVSYINWGEISANTATVRVSARQRSFGIAGVASLPLAARISVHAKFGFLRTEQATTSPAARVDRSDTERHYGVGARYDLGRRWAVRTDWENANKLKARLLSLALERQL